MKNIDRYSLPVFIWTGLQIFSACKVSKDVATPNMNLPANYRYAPADTAKITALKWQAFFTDNELKVLIARALAYNNDLQVAMKNIESASLSFKQAKLGNIPVVDLEVTASSSRPSDNSLNELNLNETLQTKHIEDYTVAASLSWEADIWGKIKSRKAASLAAYLQTKEAKDVVQTQIINNVSKAYYNLLMLDAQLAIAKRNVLLDDSTLRIIQLQYTAGQVTSLAVQQAKAQELTAAALVPQFEQQIVLQEDALSILCGKVPDVIARKNNLADATFSEKLGAGLPSDILSRRPDVKQSELTLNKANADVGYAKANLYPSLTITAQGGLDAFKASNWFNIPASLFGAVVGGFTQPLFEQKKLSTRYQIAKVNRDEAVIQFRQTVLVAFGEVSDALVELDKLKQEQALAAERIATLQTATHNSQMLFKNGLATYLEVITAQGNVLQSELELAAIKKDRLDATVDLYRALGGGIN